MLDSKGHNVAIMEKLKSDLAESLGCEGPKDFNELVKRLSNDFYNYFNCSSRGYIVHKLVDIQAKLELSEKNLRDFEILSKGLFNVIFTLRALGSEIEKLKVSLELLYTNVQEFWESVKAIDSQNVKIIRIITETWSILKNLKTHLYTISGHQKDLMEKNVGLDMMSFSEYFSCSPNEELNWLLKSLGNSSIYFSETFRQLKYLNHLLCNHHKLKSIHILFSFQLVLLINKPFAEVSSQKESKSKSCFPRPKFKTTVPIVNVSESVLQHFQRQSLQVGKSIYSETHEIREIHCASLRREEIVLADIQLKRMELLRGLSSLQSIVSWFTEMGTCNDNLVGKLTKSRNLFNNIKEYLKYDLSNFYNLSEDEDKSDSYN